MINRKKIPFVLYVYGILGKEVLVIPVNLSLLMAEKMEEPILQVRGWVNGRTEIAVARLYYRIICGARLPSPLQDRDLDWESGLGLGLA